MSEMNIGYNIQKGEELRDKICYAYEALGLYAEEQWEPVKNTLRNNWVGEDEQDYEKKLIEKICKLYVDSYNIVNSATTTIKNLTNAWFEMQRNNTLDGSATSLSSGINLDDVTISPNDQIIRFNQLTFNDNTNRGLVNSDSPAQIKSALETFVNGIKSKTDSLFEEITVNEAFFGLQTNAIKGYIDECGKAIAEVTIAVKDIYDAVDVLLSRNYVNATSDVSTEMNSGKSDVASSTDALGSSKWNA